MKKKLVALLGVSLVLAACGNETESSEDSSSQEPQTEQTETNDQTQNTSQQSTQDQQSQQTQQEQPQQTSSSLDENGVVVDYPYELNTENAGYVINNVERSEGSMTGAPIMTLNMTFTNTSDQTQSPYMQFVKDFNVIQTDGTTTDALSGANTEMDHLENQEAVEMGNTQVNPGATVDATIGYQLEYQDGGVAFIYRPSEITGENSGFIIQD